MSSINQITGGWPLPSSGDQSKRVKFPAGVDSLAEDHEQAEVFREEADIIRFNASTHNPGIISKKSNIFTTLFPTPGVGLQFSISSGPAITGNGGIINVIASITKNDVTAIPGYQDPTVNDVYLVLRKTAQEYASRYHSKSGISYYTRVDILGSGDIVEFLVNPTFDVLSNAITSDRNVTVLGRLESISPLTFDTTETTGKRMICRNTEVPLVEVTGATMEGDLFFQNIYNSFDFPQWGKDHWSKRGGTHNKDFIRLFSRVNYQMALLRGVKFGAITIGPKQGFGLIFEASNYPKIRLFPNLQPPQIVNLVFNEGKIIIPENNVMYLNLSDSHLLIEQGSSGGGGGNQQQEQGDNSGGGGGGSTGSITDPSYSFNPYLTSINLGDSLNGDLKRFPICWHYYNGSEPNSRKLIFADGTILKLEEEITSEGNHSSYLRRNGVEPGNNHDKNYLTGNLEIFRDNATLILTEASESALGGDIAGLEWRLYPPNNNVVVAEMKRFRALSSNEGLDFPPPEGITLGDIYLTLYDQTGLQGSTYIWKKNGRFHVHAAAVLPSEALRLNEGLDKRGENLSNNHLTGSLKIFGNNPQLILQDSTAGDGFQGIQFKKGDGGGIGYIERESEAGTDSIFIDGWEEGDMLFATTNNGGTIAGGFRYSLNGDKIIVKNIQATGNIQAGNLQVENIQANNDGTINDQLYVGDNIRFPYSTDSNPSQESLKNTLYHRSYGGQLSGDNHQIDSQLRVGYAPNQQYSLINYSDATSNNVTIAATTESSSLCIIGIPVNTSYNKILININLSIKITGGTGLQETLITRLKNQSGTLLKIFKSNIIYPAGAPATSYFHFSYTEILDSSSNNAALYFTVQRGAEAADVVVLTNDTTDGETKLSYVVII